MCGFRSRVPIGRQRSGKGQAGENKANGSLGSQPAKGSPKTDQRGEAGGRREGKRELFLLTLRRGCAKVDGQEGLVMEVKVGI